MSSVKTIFATNPLAKAIQTPGGRRVAQLLARAEKNLLTIRDNLVEALDRHLAVMEDTRAAVGAGPADGPHLEMLYKCAGDIVTVAAACGFEALGRAAYSLCELTDQMREQGYWDPAGLDVHLSALRLLRSEQAPGDKVVLEQMLDGLKRISTRGAPG